MSIQTKIADGIYAHGFHVIDNFLDDDTYRALRATIQAMHQDGHFKPAKIGQNNLKTINMAIRNDAICWLDKPGINNAVKTYFVEIEKLCNILNQSLLLGLIDYEAHFAIYQPNNFYKKHIDQFKTTLDRRISCVYYLNNEWSEANGGELLLYNTNEQPLTTIAPEGNRFVCFNSSMVHEVRTAYQLRYSIATWLKIRHMSNL